MSHRVLPALLLAPLLLCGRADAGDPPAPAGVPAAPPAKAEQPWHKQLAHRNARYASLARVDDPAGDVHEAIIAHMNLNRVVDPVGDMEQVRVARAIGKIPPRATADAFVARAEDDPGDLGELTRRELTNERRFAETRRFRDVGGDRHELTRHLRDVKIKHRLAQENVIGHAAGVQRLGVIDRRADLSDDEAERARAAAEEREDPIGGRERDPFERDPIERDPIERDPIDMDLLGAERLEEKLQENQAEAQAERAEGGGTGGGAP